MSAVAPEIRTRHRPRLGFLGAGWIGRMRMQAVASSELAQIAAIADPADRALADAAKIAPGAELLSGLDDLLARNLDGLVIATPSAFHADQAITALNAGIAVFCQKPVAPSADTTRQVIEAARRADRLLATDFAYRFTDGMQAVRELITHRVLGRIYAAEFCFHNSYGPDQPWYYDRALSGGGCVIDFGIHLVDLALWALDFPTVRRVSSRLFCGGQPYRASDGSKVEDFAAGDLELEGDILVRVGCSWRRPIGREALIRAIYHGDRGAAEFHNVDGSFFDFRADHYWARERRQLSEPPDNWSGRALLDWIARLSASKRFDPNAKEIDSVAQVIDLIYRSSGGDADSTGRRGAPSGLLGRSRAEQG